MFLLYHHWNSIFFLKYSNTKRIIPIYTNWNEIWCLHFTSDFSTAKPLIWWWHWLGVIQERIINVKCLIIPFPFVYTSSYLNGSHNYTNYEECQNNLLHSSIGDGKDIKKWETCSFLNCKQIPAVNMFDRVVVTSTKRSKYNLQPTRT